MYANGPPTELILLATVLSKSIPSLLVRSVLVQYKYSYTLQNVPHKSLYFDMHFLILHLVAVIYYGNSIGNHQYYFIDYYNILRNFVHFDICTSWF